MIMNKENFFAGRLYQIDFQRRLQISDWWSDASRRVLPQPTRLNNLALGSRVKAVSTDWAIVRSDVPGSDKVSS